MVSGSCWEEPFQVKLPRENGREHGGTEVNGMIHLIRKSECTSIYSTCLGTIISIKKLN